MTKYKTCFVPNCLNTTISSPSKIFFYVPEDEKRRKLWFKVARRPDIPTKSQYYCCQDHFKIKEDMESYIKFSMVGGPAKLKKDAIPHIFDCQPSRTHLHEKADRSAFQKLNRKREITEILKNTNTVVKKNISGTIEPSTSFSSSSNKDTEKKKKPDEEEERLVKIRKTENV